MSTLYWARGCVIEHEVAKNYGLEILGYKD